MDPPNSTPRAAKRQSLRSKVKSKSVEDAATMTDPLDGLVMTNSGTSNVDVKVEGPTSPKKSPSATARKMPAKEQDSVNVETFSDLPTSKRKRSVKLGSKLAYQTSPGDWVEISPENETKDSINDAGLLLEEPVGSHGQFAAISHGPSAGFELDGIFEDLARSSKAKTEESFSREMRSVFLSQTMIENDESRNEPLEELLRLSQLASNEKQTHVSTSAPRRNSSVQSFSSIDKTKMFANDDSKKEIIVSDSVSSVSTPVTDEGGPIVVLARSEIHAALSHDQVEDGSTRDAALVEKPKPSRRASPMVSKTPFQFRLYDVAEQSVVEGGQLKNYVVCFGRNPQGERVSIFVQNVPHEIYLAVPEDTTDQTRVELERFLNAELLRKNRFQQHCRLTDCQRCYPQNNIGDLELVKDAPIADGDGDDVDDGNEASFSIQEAIAEMDADDPDAPIPSTKEKKQVGKTKGAKQRKPPSSISSEPCVHDRKKDVRPVLGSSFVRRRGFVGYEKEPRKFIKFILSGAFYAREAEKSLIGKTSGSLCAGLGTKRGAYEICPNAVDSFMRLLDAKGFFWYETSKYRTRLKGKETLAKHELIVDFADLKEMQEQPSPASAEHQAPVVSLVLDIETISDRPNGVSNPLNHPIGMIGVQVVNDLDPSKNERRIFTWNVPASIKTIQEPFEDDIKTTVDRQSSEVLMLMRFRAFVLKTDPDLLVGYNSNNFDIPYILTRAKVLNEPRVLDLGLFTNRPCRHMQVEKRSNQTGTRKMSLLDVPGRTCFDLYPFSLSRLKLRRYRMQDVIEHLDPGMKKGDMAYGDIHKFFNGSVEQKRTLLEYCILDSFLTARILQNLSAVPTLVAQSQVFRAKPSDVLEKGQMARNARLIRGWTKNEYLIPSLGSFDSSTRHDKFADCELYVKQWGPGKSIHFEGGRVFEPHRGKHEFVTSYDFNSLYPSIIRAHNLCHTTHIFSDEHLRRAGLELKDVRETVDIGPEATRGDREKETFLFVRENVREGVLPRMLTSLLEARKRTKRARDESKDPRVKQALDAEQDSYKLCANSVYGLLGFRGELENIAIAASVTAYGRHYIQEARLAVENKYKDKLDFIYGDTDSVMFSAAKSCNDSLDDARKLGNDVANFLNSSGVFPPPMKIEFEKIFKSMLLEDKKRYAGHAFDAGLGSTKGKFFARGLETVRRDFPPYVSDCLKDLLAKMLIERKSDEELLAFVRDAGSSLLLGKIPADRLKLTAALSKPLEDYATPARQPHVAAARVLQAQGLEVKAGDRVEYVYVAKHLEEGAKASLKSERALPWTLFTAPNSKAVIDFEEYFDKLSGPFKRALFYLPQEKLGPVFDKYRYDRVGPDGDVMGADIMFDEPFVAKKKRSTTKKAAKTESTLSMPPILSNPTLSISASSTSPSPAIMPSLTRQHFHQAVWTRSQAFSPAIQNGSLLHTAPRRSISNCPIVVGRIIVRFLR